MLHEAYTKTKVIWPSDTFGPSGERNRMFFNLQKLERAVP
jgi:hypothetical protein